MQLIHYDAARIAVEKAATVDDAKKIKDQAAALEAYAKQRRDSAMEAWLSEIKVRAGIRIGEISKQLEKAQGSRSDQLLSSAGKKLKKDALKNAGISQTAAFRYESLADISNGRKAELEEFIRKKVAAAKPIKFTEIETFFIKQKKDDDNKNALYSKTPIQNTGLIVGDFKKQSDQIGDATVELIFTDPPYDRKSLDLYEDAARIGARILKPGGSLICYCGQYLVPDILQGMQKYLKFWWINACVHTGQQARMKEYGIIVGWKPLLWFVKNRRGDKQMFISDVVSGGREKDTMAWQQSIDEAVYYIKNLTSKGGLIVDFFAGGGTTCIAANKLGRKWLAFENDPLMAKKADKRISEIVKSNDAKI